MRGGRRRWIAFGVVLLFVGSGAAGGWLWYRSRSAVLLDPPMPANIGEDDVRQVLEQARQRVLDDPRSADAWGQFGLTLLAHLFDRRADICFREAARLAPSDARWPYSRGLIALKRDPEYALHFFEQATELAGESWPEHRGDLCLQWAEALLEYGRLEKSEKLYREEWRRRPGDARTALGLGRIALMHGDYKAAADFLTTARNSPFAEKTATVQLAALARQRGDSVSADRYEKEYATLPDDPPWPDPILDEAARLQVGRRGRERRVGELELHEQYAEAAEIWLRQLQKKRTMRACVGAGINLARSGDYARAVPLLREGVGLAPDDALAQYTLALVLFSQTEKEWRQSPHSESVKEGFREALAHARRAAELKPDYAMAYLFWGLCLHHLGDFEKAVAPLRRGVACRPELFELQLALGEALLESGRRDEAETHLRNAQRLDPKDSRPVEALERLREKKHQ